MRQKILGLSKTRRGLHKKLAPGQLNLEKFLPASNAVAMNVGRKLDISVGALSTLLKMYARGPAISDEARDHIFEFLVIVNEAIREVANAEEADLRVHFSDDTVEEITDDSDATLRNIGRKVKECISFLKKLLTRTNKAKTDESKKELRQLVSAFDSAIVTSMREAKRLHLEDIREAVAAPNVNMGAAPSAEAAPSASRSRSMSRSASASKNVDDLMRALGGLGL